MSIVYYRAADTGYSRNAILLSALENAGVSIRLVPQAPRHILANSVIETTRLLAGTWRGQNMAAVFLGCFSSALFPLAWGVAKMYRIPLITDFFISKFASAVYDRGTVERDAWKAKRLLWTDRIIFRHSDIILTDTATHYDYFASLFGGRANQPHYVIPVGVEQNIFKPQPDDEKSNRGRPIKVLFWGTFIPLHGIDCILRAADLLKERNQLQFTLIGNGQTYDQMHALCQRLELTNVAMNGKRLPQRELAHRIRTADIALGIFGESQKAASVIPNKVYQAMACGTPVITMDSPAIQEFPGLDDVLFTCQNRPASLANAIVDLANNPALRETLSERSIAYFERSFSIRALSNRLRRVLQEQCPQSIG